MSKSRWVHGSSEAQSGRDGGLIGCSAEDVLRRPEPARHSGGVRRQSFWVQRPPPAFSLKQMAPALSRLLNTS